MGADGLVMSIIGRALMPPLQGTIINFREIGLFPAVNGSFVLTDVNLSRIIVSVLLN